VVSWETRRDRGARRLHSCAARGRSARDDPRDRLDLVAFQKKAGIHGKWSIQSEAVQIIHEKFRMPQSLDTGARPTRGVQRASVTVAPA